MEAENLPHLISFEGNATAGNDHVNRSQSANDSCLTGMHVVAAEATVSDLLLALKVPEKARC